jgi:hypothetical protein
MEAVSDFLLAVIAGIVSYYICKWLDDHHSKPSEAGSIWRGGAAE